MTSRDSQSFAAPFDVTPTLGDVGANESLLARARALEPIIREHVDTTERDRRLARPVLHAMREAGLFRMFTPSAFGGLEADPVTVARVVEEIASFDSAAAWALQAGNTGSWWAGHFPATGIAELYADGPDFVMSASFTPPHRAESVPGGYRFSGRGALASTIHDSPWVFMTGIVFDGEQARTTSFGPVVVGLALRTSEVQIIDTWQSLGMRGTDSNDVAADGVFVPEARSSPPLTTPRNSSPARSFGCRRSPRLTSSSLLWRSPSHAARSPQFVSSQIARLHSDRPRRCGTDRQYSSRWPMPRRNSAQHGSCSMRGSPSHGSASSRIIRRRSNIAPI